MKTFKQIIREFWLPLVIATSWTIYVHWNKTVGLESLVSSFGPAFFLASWMTGQFFRIKRQEHVQSGLSTLEGRLQSLVGNLEDQAKDITAYTTGGDSYCYFGIGIENNLITLTVVHQGKYPLYDLHARIVDLTIFDASTSTGYPLEADTNLAIGELAPNQAKMLAKMDIGRGSSKDFNVFFSARNGFFTQPIRFRFIDDKWLCATEVHTNSLLGSKSSVLQRVDDGYPISVDDRPEGF